jgi:hypothetical protein
MLERVVGSKWAQRNQPVCQPGVVEATCHAKSITEFEQWLLSAS